jgi:hypothetical protein
MRLGFAVALILTELGAGVLLFLPLVPIAEVRKSYFSFHSMLAAICFALAAVVLRGSLQQPCLDGGLLIATVLCAASFGTARWGKFTLTRVFHNVAVFMVVVFSLYGTVLTMGFKASEAAGSGGFSTTLLLLWLLNALLGAWLLGSAHGAMALGHWYLIMRNLSFEHLIRATKVLMLSLTVRAAFLILCWALISRTEYFYTQSYLRHLFFGGVDFLFFLMRVLWGLLLPFIFAFMAWRCTLSKSNQAATGLLYLCEVSVLFGELFAAYLMI